MYVRHTNTYWHFQTTQSWATTYLGLKPQHRQKSAMDCTARKFPFMCWGGGAMLAHVLEVLLSLAHFAPFNFHFRVSIKCYWSQKICLFLKTYCFYVEIREIKHKQNKVDVRLKKMVSFVGRITRNSMKYFVFKYYLLGVEITETTIFSNSFVTWSQIPVFCDQRHLWDPQNKQLTWVFMKERDKNATSTLKT